MPTQHTVSARDLVTSRLAARAEQFPDVDLVPLDVSRLSPRDAALARAIDQAVARRWLTLARIIDSRLDQDWDRLEPNVQAPLLVGAAQLLLMERLPDHAVINEAVNWTKHHARPKAGGLVNAVLRRIAALRGDILPHMPGSPLQRDRLELEDGRARMLTEAVFDSDPVRLLAQQTSHAEALIAHWAAAFGFEAAHSLAMHNLVQPPIIMTGLPAAATATPGLIPHDEPGFFVWQGSHDELVQLLAQHPGARVQDVTTAKSVACTKRMDPPPQTIIEVCAGRGTKTKQLALLHPQAQIIATDIDAARLSALRESTQGHDRITVIPFAELERYRGRADLIVLDVPCSNTGVLARRVEAKYRFSRESTAGVVKLQRQIIADAIPLLAGARDRSAGWLLYATCSIEPAENQEQRDWIARWHKMTEVEGGLHMPRGVPGDPPASYADGGYHTLMAWGRARA